MTDENITYINADAIREGEIHIIWHAKQVVVVNFMSTFLSVMCKTGGSRSTMNKRVFLLTFLG